MPPSTSMNRPGEPGKRRTRRSPRATVTRHPHPTQSGQAPPATVFRMRNPGWDHQPFRATILAAANAAGLETAADISRATGDAIKQSQLSKWLRGVERPAVGSLRILARVLGLPLPQLLVLAGRADESELDLAEIPELTAPTPLHRLTIEVERRLAATSSLSDEDREAFEFLIESVVTRFPLRRTRGTSTG